jgi:hypothetical protein
MKNAEMEKVAMLIPKGGARVGGVFYCFPSRIQVGLGGGGVQTITAACNKYTTDTGICVYPNHQSGNTHNTLGLGLILHRALGAVGNRKQKPAERGVSGGRRDGRIYIYIYGTRQRSG